MLAADYRQSVLVAVKELGPPYCPWMWRQIAGMPSLDLQIMYWMPGGVNALPDTSVPVHVLDADPTPYDGLGRWMYRLANLPGQNFYAANRKERRGIRDLMMSVRPSVLLCYYGDIALRTVDVANEMNIPVIAYFHGDFSYRQNRWYRWSLQTRMGKLAAIVVVTEEEKMWFTSQGVPARKIHVIPCGAPTKQFLPLRDKTHGGVRFMMVSRLAREKGCRESISAFVEVRRKARSATLDIYGDGPTRGELQELVQARGLGAHIRFHGHVSSTVLADALPRHDVFIQHSLVREGSPVSIAEAMSCGLPIVATAVGGNVDLIVDGQTGFLVAERDVSGMADAMLRLAEDAPMREIMGKRARHRAVEFFDSFALTGQLERLVAEVGMRHIVHDLSSVSLELSKE